MGKRAGIISYMTRFDKIIISISVFAFCLVWSVYLADSIVAAVFISLLVTILILSVGLHLLNRREDKSRISVSEMENLLALYGQEYQINLLKRAIPDYFKPETIENGVIFTRNCKKAGAFINYKYSSLGLEDLARIYRTAKKHEVEKIYVLARPSPRNVLVLAASLDAEFVFVASRQFHKYLYKQNLLMDKPRKKKKPKPQRPKFREVLSEIFQRKRAKYFFFCALTLGLYLIFTPYKVYYLVMVSLSLALAVACVARRA